eukprot:SAG22_NODE_2947_length_2083_cov_19.140697_2_plen_92_part_00
MGELHKVHGEKVALLLVNCEPDKSSEDLKAFADKNDIGDIPHLRLKDPNANPYKGYFPYHAVFKEGVCVLSGGYDMAKKEWKDWEGVAGLK